MLKKHKEVIFLMEVSEIWSAQGNLLGLVIFNWSIIYLDLEVSNELARCADDTELCN